MKSLIVEDEPLVAKDLQKILFEIDPSIEIQQVLESVDSAVSWLKSNPEPELIFMDIQLSDGVSFDIFSKVQIHCPVIFTTAYNDYAIRAFKVNSIDYLLKPIEKSDLTRAIEKYRRMKSAGGIDVKEQIQSLISQISFPTDKKLYKERFTAHSGKSLIVINHSNIASFQKDALIYINTNDKQQFITDYQSMEEIEELLNPKLFFRANRQYILNINSIESYRTDTYSKLIVKLKSPLNTTVDISREKAQAFKSWLQ